MEVNSSMNLLNLCRVCVQDVTDIPSENIFDSAGPDCPSIYIKLSAICSQVFATDSIEKPLADHAKALPPIVCSDCKSKIDEAYKLHQMCLEGNRKLWEWLMTPPETTIKEEYVEDVIQVEPTQLQMPEVFAESLDVLAEKSPAPPKRKSTTKGRVQKEVKKPRQIKCEKCRVMTIREHAMFKHMKLKHPDEALPCYKCKKVYFDKAKLEEHVLIHTTIKRHPCLNCQKLFKTAAELRIHVNVCTGQTPFLCTECGKAFSYAASLQMHRLQHKEKSYACDRCPSKFRQKGTLKTHMLTHTKERKFHCETCGVRFRLKNGLMQHQKTHTGEKPYGCDLCSMRFRDTASLRRHVRTHTGEKPFKCTHCDRAFAQTGDLAKHSRTHFGDNPYKCERCDAAFRLLADLRNHYKVHYQAGDNATGDQPDEIQFTIVSTLNRRAEQEKNRESHQVDQMLDERIELEMKQGAFDLDTSTTKDTENLESVSKPMVPGFESTMIQAILKLDGTNNAEQVKPVVSFAAATNSGPAFSGDATTGKTVPFGVSQGTTPVLNLTKEKQPEPKKKDKTMEETKKDEPLPPTVQSFSASEEVAEPAFPALRHLLQKVDSTTADTPEPSNADTSTAIIAHSSGLFGSIKPPSNASRIAGLFSSFRFNTTETATTTASTTSTLFGSLKPATTRANSSTGFCFGGTSSGFPFTYVFGNKLTDLSVKSEPATSEATPLCATVASTITVTTTIISTAPAVPSSSAVTTTTTTITTSSGFRFDSVTSSSATITTASDTAPTTSTADTTSNLFGSFIICSPSSPASPKDFSGNIFLCTSFATPKSTTSIFGGVTVGTTSAVTAEKSKPISVFATFTSAKKPKTGLFRSVATSGTGSRGSIFDTASATSFPFGASVGGTSGSGLFGSVSFPPSRTGSIYGEAGLFGSVTSISAAGGFIFGGTSTFGGVGANRTGSIFGGANSGARRVTSEHHRSDS